MLLKDVWIDAPHRHRRLTLFRLMDPEGRTLPYRLMSKALEAGTLAAVGDRVVGMDLVGGELTDGTGDVRDGERLVHLSAFPEGR